MEALYTLLQMLEVTIRNRFQEAKEGKAIPHEEVIAELREKARQGKLESAIWDRSMDWPLFEE